MEHRHLVGRRFRLRGFDPDLLGTPLSGEIHAIDLSAQLLLLRFTPPVQIGNEACRFAVAQPRLQRDTLNALSSNAVIGCGITCVPDRCYDPHDPFNLSWWRGGEVMIADLVLTSHGD
jgi:hypothetical protein